MKSTIFPLLLLLLFMASCFSPGKVSNRNFAHLYKGSLTPLNPEYVIYHETDSVSKIYYSFDAKELLFSRKENDEDFTARLKFSYIVYESFESHIVLDSSFTIVSVVGIPDSKKIIRGEIAFKSPANKKSLLEIVAFDINRNNKDIKYFSIDKTSKSSAQNFLLLDAETKLPMPYPFISPGKNVLLKHNRNLNELFCRYYNRDFPLALPPFALNNPIPFNYTADSIFTVSQTDDYFHITLPDKNGIYHFLTDTSSKQGITLFQFGDYFPEVKTINQMAEPLRYVTTKKEFEEIAMSTEKKKQIDDFWLSISSSPDRARELIKHYYSRVEISNRHFSSYQEGWKTDRGLIYIVFGAPNFIYKYSDSESWIYGEENNYMSVNFNFSKIENPFSENDFQLVRSPIYKTNYYRAVDSWREGRVFVNR
jgi:GWxTD domain-containing protein